MDPSVACGFSPSRGRDQLGGDLLADDLGEELVDLAVLLPELLAVDDPADQVLHQGLRHTAISSSCAPNCSLSTTQRIRCWISVFGTPEFTV